MRVVRVGMGVVCLRMGVVYVGLGVVCASVGDSV